MSEIRFVAIGDSFTEGVGDEIVDEAGTVRARGWADFVAQGLATATGKPIQYANLAIRGRLLQPIIDEQLEPALALRPTLVTFNGGGNDMLRPGTDIPWVVGRTRAAIQRILEAGARPVLLAGANPTRALPGGTRIQAKGDALTKAADAIAREFDITFVNNWNDDELANRQYWSRDRLHLDEIGHRRVARNVLAALGHEVPVEWIIDADPVPSPRRRDNVRFAAEHVLPW